MLAAITVPSSEYEPEKAKASLTTASTGGLEILITGAVVSTAAPNPISQDNKNMLKNDANKTQILTFFIGIHLLFYIQKSQTYECH